MSVSLEMQNLSFYKGSVKGGPYTEDSERHAIEGSGNGAFFYWSPQGEPKALSKGGLGQCVYWAATCTSYILTT
jgi:hypothetical protein